MSTRLTPPPGQHLGESAGQAPPPTLTGQQVASPAAQTPKGSRSVGGQHWGRRPPHEPPPRSAGQQVNDSGLHETSDAVRAASRTLGAMPNRSTQHLGNVVGQQPVPQVRGASAGQVAAGAGGLDGLGAMVSVGCWPLRFFFPFLPLATLSPVNPRPTGSDAASAPRLTRTTRRRDARSNAPRTRSSNRSLSNVNLLVPL